MSAVNKEGRGVDLGSEFPEHLDTESDPRLKDEDVPPDAPQYPHEHSQEAFETSVRKPYKPMMANKRLGDLKQDLIARGMDVTAVAAMSFEELEQAWIDNVGVEAAIDQEQQAQPEAVADDEITEADIRAALEASKTKHEEENYDGEEAEEEVEAGEAAADAEAEEEREDKEGGEEADAGDRDEAGDAEGDGEEDVDDGANKDVVDIIESSVRDLRVLLDDAFDSDLVGEEFFDEMESGIEELQQVLERDIVEAFENGQIEADDIDDIIGDEDGNI